MLIRFYILLGLAAFLSPLRAQDEPIHMKPEFPLIFPVVKNGEDVTVKYPILINPATILKPGMVLRTLYILNYNTADGSADLALAHAGNSQQAYSRETLTASQQAQMPPELAHELEGYRRTVWDVPNNFVLAMAQYPTDAMHLIYCATKDNRQLLDERFSFFDGLMVGSPNGHVTVIAVEKESHADKAGIKAGDEIVSVGGIPTKDDLATFASGYSTTKKNSSENGVMSYPMSIRSAGAAEPHTVNIPMPPTIKGGLMQGF